MTSNNGNKKRQEKRAAAGAKLVAKAKRQATVAKKRLQRKPIYKPRASDDVKQYEVALRHPFAISAMGVRVPDSFCFPTVTYHYRTSLIMTADGSGNISMAIFPSPALTMAQEQGTLSGGATSFTANGEVYYLVSPTQLASKLTEYRVVSWGIRLLAKDTAFNSKGKVSIAMVPTTNNAPSWNSVENTTATSTGVVTEYIAGFNVQYLSSTINNYPAVRTFSMQDLLREDIEVSGMPLNASFHDFRGTTDRTTTPWSATTFLADEVVTSGTALTSGVAAGRKDVANLRGGVAILICATGLTGNLNAFDVDIIYHLEGTPNLSDGAGFTTGIVPSSQAVVNGSAMLVDRAMHRARTAGPLIGTGNSQGTGATRRVRFQK